MEDQMENAAVNVLREALGINAAASVESVAGGLSMRGFYIQVWGTA